MALGASLQQPAFVLRVAPGPGDDTGAPLRAYLVGIGLDPGVDGLRVDQPFFDQQGFQRLDAQRLLGRQMAMQMLMDMGNFAGVDLGHRDELRLCRALQSTESKNRFHFSRP